MAFGDTFEVALKHTLAGQQLVSVHHVRQEDAVGDAMTQLTAGAVATRIKDCQRERQVDDVNYTGWSVRAVRGGGVVRDSATCKRSGGLALEGIFTGLLTGADAADPLPPQDAVVVTAKTLSAGRSKRGRHYISGWSEANQSAGTVTPAVVSAYQADWDALLAAFGPAGAFQSFRLVVWSETIASGCKPSALHPHQRTFIPALGQHPELAATDISSYVVRGVIRSQRRRQLGVGL